MSGHTVVKQCCKCGRGFESLPRERRHFCEDCKPKKGSKL